MPHVTLALGSNLGNRHATIIRAIDALCHSVGPIVRAMPIVQTQPWGYQSHHPYLNTITHHATNLTPHELLRATQAIEQALGRTTKTAPAADGQLPTYADRTIDIDILLYDDLHIHTPELTIPHPHIADRPFVREPLRELLHSLE